MEKKLPACPREAWMEDTFSLDSGSLDASLSSGHDVTVLQPLQPDDSWLPVYKIETEAVDFILAFVTDPDKEERQKVTFLKSIRILCRAAFTYDLTQGLDLFCCAYELPEIIKMLLEAEPRDQLRTEIRYLSMMAIKALSLVQTALKGKTKSLLLACFSSVFWLPPEKEMADQDIPLYVTTLISMDSMLKTMVLNSSVSDELQDIFEWLRRVVAAYLSGHESGFGAFVTGFGRDPRADTPLQDLFEILLDFTKSEREAVRERAVGRIDVLAHLLSNYFTLQARFDVERDTSSPGDIQITILGKLLGRLILFRFSKEQTSYPAFHALFSISDFMYESRTKDGERQLHWKATTISSLCSLSARDCTQAFGTYLWPHERTDVILVAIEAMKDPSILDKQVPSSMLDVALQDPDFWLTDMPKIVSCILENLEYIKKKSSWKKVESLLLLLTYQYPTTVVIILCKSALQGYSAVLKLWEMMSSMPEILDKILKEFAILLQKQCFICSTEDTCTHHKASSFSKSELKESDDEPDVESDQGCPDGMTASLLLEGLIGLSERVEMARKIEIFLPGMVKILQVGSKDAKMKILVVLRNVLAQLKRTKASFVTVQLVGRLLPLFDSECSQLRELSICMFTELLGLVVGKDEKRIRKEVRRALVPLLFHVSDHIPSVAEASKKALLAVAELLNWTTFKHLLERERMWELGACLLAKSPSRAEEYMHQSLPYLQDPQADVRLAAVRFIGLITRRMSGQTMETQADLLTALQPLESDFDISVSSLATQTTLFLRRPSLHQSSRGILRKLFCCCCQ